MPFAGRDVHFRVADGVLTVIDDFLRDILNIFSSFFCNNFCEKLV